MSEPSSASMSAVDVTGPTRGRHDPEHSFLDFARVGRSGGGSYALGTALILFAWFIIGGMLTAFVAFFGIFASGGGDALGGESVDPFALDTDFGLPPWAFMLMTLLGFLPFGAAVLLVVRLVHNRPWRSVITPYRRINWGLVGKGALMWAIPMIGFGLIGVAIGFDDLTWNYEPAKFWPFAVVVIALTFIQTSSEELFFRGYLSQWIATRRRSILFISLITAVIFASVHLPNALLLGFGGSPVELVVGMLPYFAIGFVLAWVSYTSGTLELALGAHFLNNLVAFLAISSEDLPTDGALFAAGETSAVGSALTALLSCVIFWLLVRRTRGSGEPMPLVPVESGTTPPPVAVATVGAAATGAYSSTTPVGAYGSSEVANAYVPGANPYAPVSADPYGATAAPVADPYRAATASPAPAWVPPAGWYADPVGTGLRYWDGNAWTEHTHP